MRQTHQNPVNIIENEKSMLIDANELKNVNSEKLGNQLKKTEFCKRKDIINFSLKDNMLWKNCILKVGVLKTKETMVGKIRNRQKFLKGKAITLYVNSSLNIMH